MRYVIALASLVFLLCVPASSYGQAVGAISGTVADTSGAAVPSADVTVTNQETNVVRAAHADSSGYFTFSLLPIGTYTVRVAHEGFEPKLSRNIVLEGQQTVRLDFSMVVGSVTQNVDVTAESESEQVQRTDATLGQTIHAEQVANLPLNGRNFAQLALLTPGTTRGEQPNDFLNGGTSSEVSFRGSVALSVQGMAESANDWRYDGIDDNELTAGGVSFLPQIDAIQEFNVLTYNYSAQYGSRGGSTVLVSSKTGTNKLHGSLFEFFRNDYLDARNYFDPVRKGKYRQNEYGGSLGGPIFKDKTFFFVDYQANRIRSSAPVLSTVPWGEQITQHIFRNPIFDPSTTLSVPIPNPNPLRRNSYYDASISAYRIPAAQVSPIGQAILNLYPQNAPAPGTNGFPIGINYSSNPTRTLNDDLFDVRVDHQLSEKDRVFARFSWDNANQFNPSGLPGYGARTSFVSTTTFSTRARHVALSESHIFSSKIVNQIALGYNRDFNYIRSIGFGSNVSASLGIQGANLGDSSTSGLTLFTLTGFNPVGDRNYSPYLGGTEIWHAFDSLSIVKGSHNMVFGFDFRPQQMNGIGQTYLHGQMGFTKNFTGQLNNAGGFDANTTDPVSGITGTNGNPVASLLLGYPNNGNRTNQINSTILGRRWKEYRGYFQDNWTVTPELTLNFGVAYGVTTPVTEARDRLANFDVTNGNYYVAGTGAPASAKVFISDKYAGVRTDFSNIEPRISFSFSPFGVQRNTVLRGGYGIFHDVSHVGVSTMIHQNPPYVNTYTFTANDIGTPARNLLPNNANNGFPDNGSLKDPAAYTGSLVAMDRNFKQGLVQQYNLNLQTGTQRGTVFTLAYAGTHATRLYNSSANFNAAGPGAGNNAAINRPYTTLNTISYIVSNGWLLYNSLQGKVERRVHDLYLLGSYTYAQGLTNGFIEGVTAGAGTPYFPLTTRPNILVSRSNAPATQELDRGLSGFTLRSNMVASAVYTLPFGKGKKFMSNAGPIGDRLVGGWQVNTIFITHTGYPLSFSQVTNTSGAGITNRPDIDTSCDLYAGAKTVQKWFNTSCILAPQAQRLGNAPRTYGYGPGRTNVDLSFYKKMRTFEHQNLEFRAEFFNILNHSQFALPDVGFGNATFGTITATVVSNRQTQFALKYLF